MGAGTARAQPWPKRLLRWAIVAVVAWFAWRAVTRIVGGVDWGAVGAAFGHLAGWSFAPLVALLLVRQLLNAVPLTYYVPGLGLLRSFQNDTVANLAGTFAPPPGDVVLRIAMFRSWGLDAVKGMTGVTLNMAKFYVIRFIAPALGIFALGLLEVERRHYVVAATCGLASVAFLVALALLLRSEALAAWLGRTPGRLVRPFRKSVDPERWARYLVELRATTADSLRRGIVPSLVALVGMVLADASILAVALRAFGVESAPLPLTDVYAAFLLAYPLTLLPLFGFGVLDAVLVGSLVSVAGVAHEPDVVAATVVWRVVTILGTLALGLVNLALWRLRHPAARRAATEADEPTDPDPSTSEPSNPGRNA